MILIYIIYEEWIGQMDMPDENIRCRFLGDWCKVESNVYSNARRFSEIEKTHPDVVVIDLDLYAKYERYIHYLNMLLWLNLHSRYPVFRSSKSYF